MLISHKHKFIFIKTQKTAGTSIEMALSKYCGPEDVITPDDELERIRAGFPASRNCGYAPFSTYRLKDWYRLVRRGRRKLLFYNHMPATEIQAHIDEALWQNYYKFCFDRNPWDKTISYYYFKYRTGPKLGRKDDKKIPTLSEFLHTEQLKMISDWWRYTIDDRVVVDHLGRYEDLTDELAGITRHLDLPPIEALPRLKTGIRKDQRPYKEVLSNADRDRIADVFAKEIDYFGFQY